MAFEFKDLEEGMSREIDCSVSEEQLDNYIEITGDRNPLHVSNEYSIENGFPGRLVHGSLIEGFMSTLIGVHLPGDNSLLLSLDAKFKKPILIDEEFVVKGTISEISEPTGTVKIKMDVYKKNDSKVSAVGVAMVKLRK